MDGRLFRDGSSSDNHQRGATSEEEEENNSTSIYLQNLSGAKSKVAAINTFLSTSIYPIVLAIETWFNKSVLTSELIHSTKFAAVRRDRIESASVKKDGGGTIIFFDSALACRPFDIVENYSKLVLESTSIAINANGKVTVITAVYIPPNLHKKALVDFRNMVNKLNRRNDVDHMCFCGDFNLPGINWEYSDDDVIFYTPAIKPNTTDRDACESFLEIISEFGLFQINGEANSRGQFLDLVLVSDPEAYVMCSSAIVSNLDQCTNHHSSIAFSVPATSSSWATESTMRRIDFPMTSHKISECNFRGMTPTDFAVCLSEIQQQSTRTITIVKPAWLVKHPWLADSSIYANMYKQQKQSYKRYQTTKSDVDRQLYALLSRSLRELFHSLKAAYMEKVSGTPTANSREFYQLMKSKAGKTLDMPKKLYENGAWLSGDALAKRMFDHLSSNFSDDDKFFSIDDESAKDELKQIHSRHFVQTAFWDDVDGMPTADEILSEIANLKARKGVGPHGISASLLQYNSAALIQPIFEQISHIFENGICPQFWKTSFLQPIPKKGALNDLRNYRGIAISSCLPKLLDKIIARRLKQAAEKIISPKQHGFLPKRSTTTGLLETSQLIHQSINSGHQVDVVYFDISRAFDKLNHRILAAKLAGYGMPLNLFLTTMSFVLNRRYQLKMHDTPSDHVAMPYSSIPQGSCCGPVLYIFMSNDSLDLNNADDENQTIVSAYADDTKLARIIKSNDDINILQRDINTFSKWCRDNRLLLNAAKTTFMSFAKRTRKFESTYALDGGIIKRSTSVRDLGIVFDERLVFRQHIEQVVHRAESMLAVACRYAREAGNQSLIFKVFQVHIAPLLEYNSIVWSQNATGLSLMIESVKRKATRMALAIPPNPAAFNYIPYTTRCQRLNTLTLEHRRQILLVVSAIKIIKGKMQCEWAPFLVDSLIRDRATRRPNILTEDSSMTSKSPIAIMMRTVNKFAPFFRINETALTTKTRLKCHLLSLYDEE